MSEALHRIINSKQRQENEMREDLDKALNTLASLVSSFPADDAETPDDERVNGRMVFMTYGNLREYRKVKNELRKKYGLP